MDNWKKQRDLLIEETNAFVQSVGADALLKIDFGEIIPPAVAQGVATSTHFATEVPTPKDVMGIERAVILRRVANFKANQKKFQQEREEYYTRTMANARATQWDISKPLRG